MRKVAILAYHALDASGSPVSVSPRAFAEHLRILADQPARVVGLPEIAAALAGEGDGRDLVAITFDDGFRSVYEHGMPALVRHGFPATVFLVTEYCGGDNGWPGQPDWVPRAPLLTWAQVRDMAAAGVSVGSHTRTHPDLRRIDPARAADELAGSRRQIEDALGRRVDSLAYPYGWHDRAVRRLAGLHYRWACTAELGFVPADAESLALPRLEMYYLRSPRLFARIFSPDGAAYIGLRRWVRWAGQAWRARAA